MRSSASVTLALLTALAACSTDNTNSPANDPDAAVDNNVYPVGFNPPPPPPNGVQLLGLPFIVQPGEDVFMCVYLPEELSEDLNMQALSAYQMPGGHHIILSSVIDGFEPSSPVHKCDESEMTNHRLVGVASNNETFKIQAPDGVAFQAPGGKRLVIQSHYINATDAPIEVMDAVNLIRAEGEIREVAGMMVMNDLSFELLPGQSTTREMSCTITEASTIFMLTGHTHEWGLNFSLGLTPLGSTEEEMLFDIAVGPGFRDEPPLRSFDQDNLLELKPGDKLHMRCDWFNDKPGPIYFPEEMCSAPMFYYPSRGFEVCAQDGGSFEGLDI